MNRAALCGLALLFAMAASATAGPIENLRPG